MKPFAGTPTDYSRKEHWLTQPDNPDKAVDLIFLYPSSCNDPKAGTICAVDNKSMLRGAKRNFSQQATTFEPLANTRTRPCGAVEQEGGVAVGTSRSSYRTVIVFSSAPTARSASRFAR